MATDLSFFDSIPVDLIEGFKNNAVKKKPKDCSPHLEVYWKGYVDGLEDILQSNREAKEDLIKEEKENA